MIKQFRIFRCDRIVVEIVYTDEYAEQCRLKSKKRAITAIKFS